MLDFLAYVKTLFRLTRENSTEKKHFVAIGLQTTKIHAETEKLKKSIRKLSRMKEKWWGVDFDYSQDIMIGIIDKELRGK